MPEKVTGPPDPVPQWVQDLIDARRQTVEIPEELQRRIDRLRPVVAEQVKAHADEIADSLLTYGTSWLSLKGEAVVTVEDTTRLLVRPADEGAG